MCPAWNVLQLEIGVITFLQQQEHFASVDCPTYFSHIFFLNGPEIRGRDVFFLHLCNA